MKNLKFRNVRIKQTEICLLIGLITAIVCCFCNLINNTENISKKIVRLHIMANSDSRPDQELKIKLKNAILKNFNFDECSNNINLAKQKISKKLKSIENFSENFVRKNGFPYPVKAKLGKVDFKTRAYDGFALPAGTYETLSIEIGNKEGHNWWCVLVPAMCVGAAKHKIKNAINDDRQNDLIQNGSKTEIRFVILELYEKIKHKLIKKKP